jgi:ribosomal protein L22
MLKELKKSAAQANPQKKLDKNNTSSASVRMFDTSVRKITAFAGLIRGMYLKDAVLQAQFSGTKVGLMFYGVLKSIAANAENNKNIDSDSLKIVEVCVGKDREFKRSTPRARGRSNVIKRHRSRIKVIAQSFSGEK